LLALLVPVGIIGCNDAVIVVPLTLATPFQLVCFIVVVRLVPDITAEAAWYYCLTIVGG
jgi:hypothetical protein